MSSRCLSIVALAVALAPLALAAQEPGSRDWNQPRAGPRCDAFNDVEPALLEPREAWRVAFDEVLAGPVCWGNSAYVIARRGREVALREVALETGELGRASLRVEAASSDHLAAWDGTIVRVASDRVELWKHRSSRFSPLRKPVAGAFAAAPTIDGGVLYVTSPGELVAIDLREGVELARCAIEARELAQPAAIAGAEPGSSIVAVVGAASHPKFSGTFVSLSLVDARRTGAKLALTPRKLELHPAFFEDWKPESIRQAFAAPMFNWKGEDDVRWLAWSPSRIAIASDEDYYGAFFPADSATIATAGAVIGPDLYGFDAAGRFCRFIRNGFVVAMLGAATPLSACAKRAPTTRAGRVLFTGNWAVEVESDRVLWCLAGLDPLSPMLPFADRALLVVDQDHDLVCLRADAPVAAAAADDASTFEPRSSSAKAFYRGEGIVLDDGSWAPGAPERASEGRWKAGAVEFAPEQAVAIVRAGSVELPLGGKAALDAFAHALARRHVRTLADAFDAYAADGFVEDCRRLLAEARELGVEDERLQAGALDLEVAAPPVAEEAQARRQLAARLEGRLREESLEAYLAVADWCHERALRGVAAALLARAERVHPGRPDVLQRARSWAPPSLSKERVPIAWVELAEAWIAHEGRAGEVDAPGAWIRAAAARLTSDRDFSREVVAGLAACEAAIPLERLLTLAVGEVERWPTEVACIVDVGDPPRAVELDARAVFEEQAASLCVLLLAHPDGAKRSAPIALLARGRGAANADDAARELGYALLEELAKELASFLER